MATTKLQEIISIATIVASFPLMLNDSETIIPNLVGVALLAVGGLMYNKREE